jgi:hypothetical protein
MLMPSQLDAYFAAEKAEGLGFFVFGLVACGFAVFALWRVRDPLFKGMAIPLLAVGLIQVAVGATIFARTDAQVASLRAQVQVAPADFKAQELARMSTVTSSFAVYKLIEVGFLVIGLGLALKPGIRRYWRGFGLGMLLQGALMLPADLVAEARAAAYVRTIESVP